MSCMVHVTAMPAELGLSLGEHYARKIYDNIDQKLLPSLKTTIGRADRGDFCVGLFDLRG